METGRFGGASSSRSGSSTCWLCLLGPKTCLPETVFLVCTEARRSLPSSQGITQMRCRLMASSPEPFPRAPQVPHPLPHPGSPSLSHPPA